MLAVLILLPVSLIILNIWLWLFENIFEIKDKNKTIIITIIMGLFSGIGVLLYPKLLGVINYSELNFTNTHNFGSFNIIFFFWLYLGILITLLKLLFFEKRFSGFFIMNFILFSILFLGSGYIGMQLNIEAMLIYYIFIAFGEEFTKYFIGINFYEKQQMNENDLIVFSILSALGFAFIENIVYLIGGISGANLFYGLIGGTTILITRGIIGFLVHSIFTGNIGLISYIGKTKEKIIPFILGGIAVGVSLHYTYNVMLYLNIKVVLLIFMVIGYFWISYLFYKSDRIYIKDGLETY